MFSSADMSKNNGQEIDDCKTAFKCEHEINVTFATPN